MKNFYKFLILLFLIYAQDVFSEPVYNPSNNQIDVKAFPNNDINYFFANNKAESWRLVYGKFSKPPPDDPNYEKHCNSNEEDTDEALSFDISNIIKNTGDNFNADNIHAYYVDESGKKALALILSDTKFKKSFFSIAKALVFGGDSEYAQLTPIRMTKKLKLLNDQEKNIMYVCFGYLQHLIATPIENFVGDVNVHPDIDPQKIIFWYDGLKEISTQSPKPSG